MAVINRPVLVTGLAASLGILAWLTLTGVGVLAAAATSAAVALQTSLGAIIWRSIRGSSSNGPSHLDALELLGVGFAVGSFLSMACGVLLRPLVPGGWAWILPSLIAIVVWLLRTRTRSTAAVRFAVQWPRRSVLWGALAGVSLGLAAVAVNLSRYPLHLTGAWNQFHPDMLFFEALSNSVARYGPGDSIFMTGEDLRYHWFSYVWSGQLTVSLGLEPFVMLTRVLPVVTVLAAAAIAAVWAGRYTKAAWVPGLAAILITAGGYVGATYGTLLNFDSPSQALTTVWLLALSFVVLEYVNDSVGRGALWTAGILSFACVGGKANAAIVLVVALGLLLVVGLIRRSPWRGRAAWALVVTSIPAAAAYVLVLAGSANSGGLQFLSWASRASSVQGLNLGAAGLDAAGVGVAAGTAFLMLAVIPRWAGLAGLWLEPARRWSPESVLGVGLAGAALVPLALLSQGVNELWFALSASAPLSVISAIGVGVAWELLAARAPHEVRRRAVLLVVSAGLGLLVLVAASLLWRQGTSGGISVRAFGPILAVGAAAVGALVLCWIFRSLLLGHRFALWMTIVITILVSSSALARATPLFHQTVSQETPAESAGAPVPALDVSPTEGGVVTTTSVPPSTDYDDNAWSDLEVDAARYLIANTSVDDVIVTDRTSSWLTPALTGRRTFMSGALYQELYGRASAIAAIPGRIGVSQRFAAAPSQADFDVLCASGVTWGWFSPAAGNASGSWTPYGEVVFENAAVRLVALDPSRCGASS